MNLEEISKKMAILIDLAMLWPYVQAGIKEAAEVYDKTVAGLRNGVSDEEMAAASAEMTAVLDRIIAKTAG